MQCVPRAALSHTNVSAFHEMWRFVCCPAVRLALRPWKSLHRIRCVCYGDLDLFALI